jgi:hypothetical protein
LQQTLSRCALGYSHFISSVPERYPRRHLSGATAPLPRMLSPHANPDTPTRLAENTSPPGTETVEDGWQREVIHGPFPSPVSTRCSTKYTDR